jgi:hypothetical protein
VRYSELFGKRLKTFLGDSDFYIYAAAILDGYVLESEDNGLRQTRCP